jgi:hypothetical protein
VSFSIFDPEGFFVKQYTTENEAAQEVAYMVVGRHMKPRYAKEIVRIHGYQIVDESKQPDQLESEDA